MNSGDVRCILRTSKLIFSYNGLTCTNLTLLKGPINSVCYYSAAQKWKGSAPLLEMCVCMCVCVGGGGGGRPPCPLPCSYLHDYI